MLCNFGLDPQFPSDLGTSAPRYPNGRPSTRPRPQARGPFGAPRGPKPLDKIRHSLTPPAVS
eukprot:722275-Alexandrium_andersonii.AAC.1